MSKSVERLVIERAVELLQKGHAWGALARDRYGTESDPWEHDAVKFCAAGALMRAAVALVGRDRHEAVLDNVLRRFEGVNFYEWEVDKINDRKPKRVVVRHLERWLDAL